MYSVGKMAGFGARDTLGMGEKAVCCTKSHGIRMDTSAGLVTSGEVSDLRSLQASAQYS